MGTGKRKKMMFAVELLVLAAFGIFLYRMQMGLSVNNLRSDMAQKMEQIKTYLAAVNENTVSSAKDYDEIYQSKAETLAYMIQREVDGGLNPSLFQEYAHILEVNRIFVIDREGNILLQTADTRADFRRNRFNQLRQGFMTDSPSEAFNVETDGQCRRYYGARIDYERMAVLEIPADELQTKLEEASSWKNVLKNIDAGLNGFLFAVSKRDYTFLYYPDEGMVNQDAVLAGISMEQLQDGNDCWLTIGGERFYCNVLETDEAYVVCAMAQNELTSSCRVTVAIVLFVVFIVITIMIAYSFYVSEEEGKSQGADYKRVGIFYYNVRIARKIMAFAIVGICCIFVISLYMQTLFLYSKYSVSCNRHVSDVGGTLDKYEKEMEELKEQYDDKYLNKCRTAAYILQASPKLTSYSELDELCRVLNITYIYLFGMDGKVKFTNSPYSDFQLSNDPKGQSYAFHALLKGRSYLVQEAGMDDSGDYMQYIGMSLRDGEGKVTGMLQIAIQPQKLEKMLESHDISSILKEVSVGVGGFAFAVSREDNTIAYFPEKKYIGTKAEECGITEAVLKHDFNGFMNINYIDYYGSSIETEHFYIYAVVPKSEMKGTQLFVASISTLIAFFCIVLISAALLFRTSTDRKTAAEGMETEGGKGVPFIGGRLKAWERAAADLGAAGRLAADRNDQMVTVIMPDGRVKKTESAASRWDNMSISWENRTAEQKVITLLKALIMLLDLTIVAAFLFGQYIFEENSVFYYIMNGNWERGINIFAVTACIVILCIISAAVEIVQTVLRALSRAMTARGETICRLLNSTLKYLSILAAVYYCLAQFGVDTQTLLTSAGILSLVIGLGAKDLITDILAGLFIIFEGEFQVGDIVTIGDWRGTVLEIGMRTTKIIKGGNIKIINNSNVSNVVNMTRRVSYIFCEVGIEYGENLERVEAILEKELPLIGERLEEIDGGPFYNGVASLGDKGVILSIVAQCREDVRLMLGRRLNRELKLLFDKYQIRIPYPHIVVGQEETRFK